LFEEAEVLAVKDIVLLYRFGGLVLPAHFYFKLLLSPKG